MHDAILDDRALIGRAQAGDEVALNDLMRAVRADVRSYVQRRLRSYDNGSDLAEDVTQEACLAVVRALPRYRNDDAPFGAYVFAVAAHKVADAQRRYGRVLARADDLLDRADCSPGPEQRLVASLDVEAALGLLEQLPPRAARILRLRAEGFAVDEVAVLVGLTPNATRVAQHRAHVQLRHIAAADHRH